jgi:Rad3-related DNA helicase
LLDERFKKKEIFGQISNWIANAIKIVDDFEEFKFKISAFN